MLETYNRAGPSYLFACVVFWDHLTGRYVMQDVGLYGSLALDMLLLAVTGRNESSLFRGGMSLSSRCYGHTVGDGSGLHTLLPGKYVCATV